MAFFVKNENFMTKLSWITSKKIIYFKLYRSKILNTQNFMLIPMQNHFSQILLFDSFTKFIQKQDKIWNKSIPTF